VSASRPGVGRGSGGRAVWRPHAAAVGGHRPVRCPALRERRQRKRLRYGVSAALREDGSGGRDCRSDSGGEALAAWNDMCGGGDTLVRLSWLWCQLRRCVHAVLGLDTLGESPR
jgi:hypothetical protein